ncbi:hypothetical protein GCM10009126_11140 [Rhodanobacter caeni]|uniref:Uncharacterized protein n=1 Tax=Rhodanobacter caeni TaxID=657654 RepID=A0ABN0UDV3_9GAMM
MRQSDAFGSSPCLQGEAGRGWLGIAAKIKSEPLPSPPLRAGEGEKRDAFGSSPCKQGEAGRGLLGIAAKIKSEPLPSPPLRAGEGEKRGASGFPPAGRGGRKARSLQRQRPSRLRGRAVAACPVRSAQKL